MTDGGVSGQDSKEALQIAANRVDEWIREGFRRKREQLYMAKKEARRKELLGGSEPVELTDDERYGIYRSKDNE